MADVYLAYDRQAEHKVALKLIEFSSDPDIRESIEAERRGAALQSRLCEVDPAVAGIHSFGEMEGHFYVDMEYVEGQDLAELLREGALPVDRAIPIAIGVCDALHQAHSFVTVLEDKEYLGIVHGDIKPKNIRLDSAGKVRLLDFGIAKALSLSRQLTRNEYGSVPYSSPERLETGLVTQGSDLWSLGVILYEMISGRQPFQIATTLRLEEVICSGKSPEPLPPGCPEPVRRIIMKALAPDESLRYQTAKEFRQDLEAFVSGQPTRAESERAIIDEATRRTYQRRAATAARPVRQIARDFAARALRAYYPGPRQKPLRHTLVAFVIFFVIAVVFGLTHEALVWGDATKTSKLLENRQMDVDQAWKEYQGLTNRSFVGLSTFGLRHRLIEKLINNADLVISAYRSGGAVKTADWRRANDYFFKAYKLGSNHNNTLAKFFYTEGHIHRVEGKYRSAALSFQRAAELLPDWRDAHISASGNESTRAAENLTAPSVSVSRPNQILTITPQAPSQWGRGKKQSELDEDDDKGKREERDGEKKKDKKKKKHYQYVIRVHSPDQ